MNKYVFSYDTQTLRNPPHTHEDVKKVIIRFLLLNGVIPTNIKEPVATTITFKSTLTTNDLIELIENNLVRDLRRMMANVFYYFASIKVDVNGNFYEKVRPDNVLQTNFETLINQVLNE